MTFSQINHVNVISYTCSVGSRIIITEYMKLFKLTAGNLHNVGHKIIGNAVRLFADKPAFVSADWIKIAQKRYLPFVVGNVKVAQYLLDHELCPAVGICCGKGIILAEGCFVAETVNGGRGAENKGFASVFSHDLAEKVLTRLRFDNKSRDDILELVLYHDAVIEPTPKTVRRWLNKVGEKQFMRLLDIRMADILAHRKDTQESRIDRCVALGMMASEIIEQNQCFKLKDLVIDGYDIMNLCDVKEGKDVGRILNEVLNAVISGNLENERPAIIKHLIMKGWCSDEQ